jgi:hypothetical protein
MPTQPPPTGTLLADMRQSSRDAAANRFQVWVTNDTAAAITPTKVTYTDGRFRTELPGTRLREIPSQSERGFPIYQPEQPACQSDAPSGKVIVEYGDERVTVPVQDETDVVGRYTSARCTGIAGPMLTIDTVSGTPVLSPVGTDVWRPGVTITGDQPAQRIGLPLKPTRCDAHAFAESGGATAFKIGLHLDGEPGQITLRMSTAGAANAIAFARASCGMLTDVTGGEG